MDLWSRKISKTKLPQQKWSHLQKLYKNATKDVKKVIKKKMMKILICGYMIKAKKIGLCMKYGIIEVCND